jgi:putative intracellular protease/amidase
MANLTGKKIAILATNGFEQSELLQPQSALQDAGAQTKIVSLDKARLKDGRTTTGVRKCRWILVSTRPSPMISTGFSYPAAL